MTGCPAEVADRRVLARLVHDERVDRAEVEVQDVVARRPGVGRERAMRLRTPLVAKVDLGALVAHEDRRRGADLGRDAAKDRALADREESRARTGELEDRRGRRGRFDPPHDFAEPAPEQLERDVAGAHERADRPLRSTWTLRGGARAMVPCASAWPSCPGARRA